MKTVIGYARLSTEDQSIGITLEQQIHRLKEAGAEEVYYDLASGRNDNRYKFNQLINEAKQGKISKIICTRIDRFSRNSTTSISIINDLVTQYNVNFIFLDEPFLQNLDDPNSKVLLGMQALLAQRESDCISQRVKNGIKFMKTKALALGKAPYGYMIEPVTKKYILDREPYLCLLDHKNKDNTFSRADIAREIIVNFLNLRSVAGSLKQIHLKYGIPFRRGKNTKDNLDFYLMSTTHASRWIRNPVLRGHIAYTKEEKLKKYSSSERFVRGFIDLEDYDIVNNTHLDERVLTDEEYEIIDLMLNGKKKGSCKGLKSKAYFNGILYCEECGRLLTSRHGDKYLYYFCRYSRSDCSNNKSIREDELHRVIIKEIFTKVRETNSLTKNTELHKQYSFNLNKLEEKLNIILKLLEEDSKDEALIAARDKYITQINDERIRINLPIDKILDKTAIEILNHPALKNIGFMYSLSHETRRIIYHKLIDKIVINNGNTKYIKFEV